MQTLPVRFRTKAVCASIMLIAVIACSENTESQNLNNNQNLWPDLDGAPQSGLNMIDFGPQQTAAATGEGLGPVLTDIIAHLPAEFGSKYYNADLMTWGHETSHGIHEHLRTRFNTTGRKAAAFYLLSDKAAVVAEPKILKRRLAEFIPQELQGENYALYITGQSVWDDTPFYILDEFFAHINGAAIALDTKQSKTPSGEFSPAGLAEFVSYGIALAMAVQKYDPEYFTSNHQFIAVLAVAIERAMLLYHLAAEHPEYRSQTEGQAARLYTNLTASAAGAPVREFAMHLFGHEWTSRVLLRGAGKSDTESGDVLALLRKTLPVDATPDKDSDRDGIPDRLDRCPATKAGTGAKVWTYGEWIGCAEGEQRN